MDPQKPTLANPLLCPAFALGNDATVYKGQASTKNSIIDWPVDSCVVTTTNVEMAYVETMYGEVASLVHISTFSKFYPDQYATCVQSAPVAVA